jgi:hypothetical protein
MGDKVACKGCIAAGSANIFIGKDQAVECLESASESGTPFVAPAANTGAAHSGPLPP